MEHLDSLTQFIYICRIVTVHSSMLCKCYNHPIVLCIFTCTYMYTAHDILSVLAFKPLSPSYPQEREREREREREEREVR